MLPDTVMAARFVWRIVVMATSGIREAGSLRGAGRQRAPQDRRAGRKIFKPLKIQYPYFHPVDNYR
ncbi:hypothetical protein DPT48_21845 [Salmonella enterica subsp. enterica serovar Enteritidis]|nr:hypothetical protein [Salmonella enterica subsp. enterica serovar Enteritidis]